MKKIYLGYDKRKLLTSFSYCVKKSIQYFLSKTGVTYTESIKDDFDFALFLSAADLNNSYASFIKMNKKFAILAVSDADDFEYHGEKLILNQNAFNCYSKADKLLIYYPSQEKFLRENHIETEVVYIPPFPTFKDEGQLTETERDAFKAFYQIPKEKKVIISYGSYSNPYLGEIESVARMNPECEFLFFGKGDSREIKLRTMERWSSPSNIRYHSVLPQELYRSALVSSYAVLRMKNSSSFPPFLFDLIENKVPIINYRNDSFPELINESTAIIADHVLSLYSSIRNLDSANRAEEAKRVLDEKVNSYFLETDIIKD